MPAATSDVKRVLATAIFDQKFRKELAADPKSAAESIGITLEANQVELLRDASTRLRSTEIEEKLDSMISVHKKIDLVTGRPIGDVAFHGSTSVTW